MAKRLFNKEFFIRSVKYNVRTLFRKEIEEATEQQIFQAVGYAVKDAIMDAWIATQKEYEKSDPKIVYYMSMEFLMGRALGNNLINLTFYDEVKEALEEIGLDLNTIEDQEPDAALGNGGLGRLAACFLDSLATLDGDRRRDGRGPGPSDPGANRRIFRHVPKRGDYRRKAYLL